MAIPVRPILSALTRHKAGVFLIALQVALTLAIVANAIFVISQRVIYISRPTGIDESNIVVVDNRWVGALTPEQAQAKTAAQAAGASPAATALNIVVRSVPTSVTAPMITSSWPAK